MTEPKKKGLSLWWVGVGCLVGFGIAVALDIHRPYGLGRFGFALIFGNLLALVVSWLGRPDD